MSHVILSPVESIHTHDGINPYVWRHDSDVTFCEPPTKDRCSHRCLCQTVL